MLGKEIQIKIVAAVTAAATVAAAVTAAAVVGMVPSDQEESRQGLL